MNIRTLCAGGPRLTRCLSQPLTIATVAASLLLGLIASHAVAQPYEPVNGPRQVDPGWHALVGATVVTEPGKRVENATLVIRDGVIVSVKADAEPPAGARVWDVKGLTIYPGLIEAYAPVSVAAPDESSPGAHWNAAIAAQRSALAGEGLSQEDRERLRGMGFVVAHIAPDNGLLRGQTAVVSLGEDRNLSDPTARVINPSLWHSTSLRRGSLGSSYPGSKMGAIALVRQTLADAQWWPDAVRLHEREPSKHARPAPNDAVEALADDRALLFVADDELDLLRTARLAAEFDREAVFVGSGTELRRLDAIAALQSSLIVPVSFPARPQVDTISDQNAISLRDLMMWEQAPTNLRRLHSAGVPVSVTTSGLRRGENFWKNLKSAIEHGLSEEDALAMLTTAPAELLGIAGRYGTLEPGKQASFVVVDGDLLGGSPTIRDVWTDGQRHEIKAAPVDPLSGEFEISLNRNGSSISLRVESTDRATKVTFVHAPDPDAQAAEGEEEEAESVEIQTRKVERTGSRLNLLVDASLFGEDESGTATVRLSFDGERVLGVAKLTGNRDVNFTAQRQATADDVGEEKEEDEEAETPDVPEKLAMPFGAFAYDEMPRQDPTVIHNATIWTNTDQGVIENGYVIFRDGKVERVGSGEPGGLPRIYRWIDAKGRHVTPGMMDCHSHTGISGGVNEGTQAVTAEVAIYDVIDPDDINWYRQLAGGVTAVNQLHGSANPIGGQNSVVKLRWGVNHPDDMRMESATSGIKFALGENVKQSNWGGNGRYPQTRMGVETIIRDSFIAAREYAARRDEARRANRPFRTDYELEVLAEILAGDRLIHCHSYRQDEILMLCRVAEEFGFKIGSFQHVLEGYKVAEAIKDHAIGASSFSDWWGYKVEVFDAVPYNGAIMHDVGVNVTFNSDSNEVARRLNTEAAKAVKYGDVNPEEALKFVTLNVAKQLKIDDRVGSIAPGMDADLAVWTADPLSSFARCERTFVDGREMFSLEKDAELRQAMIAERDRIIQKIIADKKAKPDKGEDAKPETEAGRALDLLASGDATPEQMLEAYRLVQQLAALEQQYLFKRRNGIDPLATSPGDCGCDEQSLLSQTR
jgi:imidazolonepropionase-like amidohydrolase